MMTWLSNLKNASVWSYLLVFLHLAVIFVAGDADIQKWIVAHFWVAKLYAFLAFVFATFHNPLPGSNSAGGSSPLTPAARTAAIAFLCLLMCGTVNAQSVVTTATPTPTPGPLINPNTGVHIDLSASFSNFTQTSAINGSSSNSATVLTLRVPLSPHFSAFLKNIIVPSSTADLVIAGAEYRWSLAQWIKPSANLKFNPQSFDLFAYGGLGGKQETNASLSAFASMVGGGVDYHLTKTLVVRALDVSYLRSSLLPNGGVVLTNHASVSTGIGMQF